MKSPTNPVRPADTSMKMYAVMRLPVLMEDEGRYRLYKCFQTKEEAKAYIKQLAEYYWKETDFVIMEEQGEHLHLRLV